MLDALKSLFGRLAPESGASPGATPPHRGDRALQVAAAAVLLEVAHSDEEFGDEERHVIETSLGEHFALEPEDVRDLMAVAEEQRRESVDLHQFSSVIVRHYGDADRLALAEMLWRVVGADGRLSSHEEALARAFRRLLDVDPARFAEVRRRALGPGGPEV